MSGQAKEARAEMGEVLAPKVMDAAAATAMDAAAATEGGQVW